MDDRAGPLAGETTAVVAVPERSFAKALRDDLQRCGLDVRAWARDADGAVTAAVSESPDLCVLSAELPGSAVVATARITQRVPRTRVVVVAATLDVEDCLTHLLAGASGYLEAGLPPDRLAGSLRAVLAGQAVVPPAATRHLIEALRGHDSSPTRDGR